MYKPIVAAVIGITIALGAEACAHYPGSRTTAESNKQIMERFTREFLPTGDSALAGQQQRGRETYLGIVAANRVAFPDLVWMVQQMVADGDTVAIRYKMTGTHRGTFFGNAPTKDINRLREEGFRAADAPR